VRWNLGALVNRSTLNFQPCTEVRAPREDAGARGDDAGDDRRDGRSPAALVGWTGSFLSPQKLTNLKRKQIMST